jgi:hypothetical protein
MNKKIMKHIWPFIYAASAVGTVLGGYQSLSSKQTAQTNVDWIFVSITFVTLLFLPLGAMAYSRRRGVETYRRPNFRRQPLGWWTDTLQPIRISLILALFLCIGSSFALPHTDPQGWMLFYWHVAMVVGLFFGERLVYLVFRERIV